MTKKEKDTINTEYLSIRSIRLSDENWAKFSKLKPRGKTWDLFIEELLAAINYFKKL